MSIYGSTETVPIPGFIYSFFQGQFLVYIDFIVFLPDIEAGTVHQILPIVQKNLGVAFFPEEMAKKAIEAGVVYEIPIKDGFPQREICIMFNPNASQSVSVKTLCSLIMKNCQSKQNIVL